MDQIKSGPPALAEKLENFQSNPALSKKPLEPNNENSLNPESTYAKSVKKHFNGAKKKSIDEKTPVKATGGA